MGSIHWPRTPNLAKSLANLGMALLDAGADYQDEALSRLRQAVDLTAELGMQSWEADTSERLGNALAAMGRLGEARPLRERAAELLETLDVRRAEALRSLLDGD